MKLHATDTSYHNGQFDWQIYKEANVQGVILKASDGFFMPNDWTAVTWDWHTDPSFIAYWKYVEDMFAWRMAYHYLRIDDEKAKHFNRPTSSEQVEYFYETVMEQGLNWNDYICLDIEQVDAELSYLDNQKIANRIENVIRKTHELFKRKPIIYSGAWWWEKYHAYFDTEFMNEYKFWLSHYWDINENNEIVDYGYNFEDRRDAVFYKNQHFAYCRVPYISKPTIDPENVILWQYSDRGKLAGIPKKFDINVILRDVEHWTEERGTPPVVSPEPPIVIDPEPEPEPPLPPEPPVVEPPVELPVEPPIEPEPPVELPTEPPVQPPDPPETPELANPIVSIIVALVRWLGAIFGRFFK